MLDRRRGDASAAILAATSCSLRGSVSARRPACTWCTKSDTPCTEAGGGAQAFAEPYGRVGHTAWWWSFRGSVPCVVGWRSWCSCGATAVVAAVVVGACGMCGLLEGGSCLGEALTGNCLLGARMVFPAAALGGDHRAWSPCRLVALRLVAPCRKPVAAGRWGVRRADCCGGTHTGNDPQLGSAQSRVSATAGKG